MKWRPWPPIVTKKFQVKLKVHSLERVSSPASKSGELGIASAATIKSGELGKVMVNMKWKGSTAGFGSRFRRRLKRARTSEKILEDGFTVNWEEEFDRLCVLTMAKDGSFLPWEVHFVIIQVATKSKPTILGTAVMNLVDFHATTENSSQTTRIRILSSGGVDHQSALVVTVNFTELTTREVLSLDRFMYPSIPCVTASPYWDKNDQQLGEDTTQKKLKNVKTSTNGKKNSGELDVLRNGKLSPMSEQSSGDSGAMFDSDSVDESGEEEAMDGEDNHFQCYGPLAGVNLVVEGALPYCRENNRLREDHELPISTKSAEETSTSDSDQGASQTTMRSLLSWKKRKISFRSPKRARGEPLLNKDYGEDGGDDIDYDRRLSGSPIEALLAQFQMKQDGTLISGCLDFGEEHFSVGSWEKKDLVSRDGQMKLSANVFFASIDQRSERAAGESACTALVAVIADWLHQNPDRMPIKAEFDTLIREGSAEWRKLCDDETCRDLFPDKHFDLDTVLKAKVRPLVVAPERSFVAFFQPEGFDDSCNFLRGAMTFEDSWEAIWEEVNRVNLDTSFEPAVYIVSWNDHFFVLKVEREACYIIDTLGERLYEGCNQAYILCFDKETSLCHVPKSEGVDTQKASPPSSDTTVATSSLPVQTSSTGTTHQEKHSGEGSCDPQEVESTVVYTGREACKQFIEGFFAALTLRELQIDMKKGRLGEVSLHQRLQIEFHFTSLGLMPSNTQGE